MRKISFRNKKLGEKSISIFEIFLLVVSIAAFAYFIGNEFQFVSATDAAAAGAGTTASTETVAPGMPSATSEYELAHIASPEVSLQAPAVAVKPAPSILDSVRVPNLAQPEVPAPKSIVETLRAAGKGGLGGPETTTVGATTPSTWTWPKDLGEFANRLWGYLGDMAWNAGIAAALYVGIRGIAEWSGWCPTCDPQLSEAWATALAAGYGAGAGLGITLAALSGNSAWGLPLLGVTGMGWGLIGLGVAFLYMAFIYKESYIVAVEYNCYPWKPNTGGADCGLCNSGDLACTKYKCQSLGQSCELLNPGKKTQACDWKDRNDPAGPTISAWLEPLTEDFEYIPLTTQTGDRGVEIRNKTGNPCLLPFKRLDYGIQLDKPGQCRIDFVRKSSFDDMTNPGIISGGDWLKEHSLFSLHGGIEAANEAGLIRLPNGGNVEIYVRCLSRNGVASTTFVFKYCVSEEPDTTAPTIKLTDLPSGSPIKFDQTSREVKVYVDKPSNCSWSHNDEDYAAMPASQRMICSQTQGSNTYFKCTTTLTDLRNEVENKFYFNCESYPAKEGTDKESERRTMATNYPYTLVGTRDLVIDSITMNELSTGATIKDSTGNVKVTLKVVTSAGYNDGAAKCWYKKTAEADNRYVLFANTYNYQNSRDLWFDSGSYEYTIKCCDLGSNCDTEETSFSIETDIVSPIVVRAYSDEGSLKIITDESAECVYNTNDEIKCSYTFEDGIRMTSSDNIAHTTEWDTNSNFYIKCKDDFNNKPTSDQCSITVRPFNGY